MKANRIKVKSPNVIYNRLLLWVLFTFISGNVSAAQSVRIEFKDSILVNDTIVRVSDIANVSSADIGLSEQIGEIVAGLSAPPGYSRFLNSDDFIQYKLKPLFQNVSFSALGAKRILIGTDFVEKRVGDFQQQLNEFFKAKILWPQGQWSVKITNLEQTFKCLNRPLNIEFDGIDNGYPKGHTNIFLTAAQGSGMNRITVICDFKVMASVWIVTSTIERGQPVKVENCELKMVDITRFAPHPFTSLKDFHNVRAARMITPGMILHDRLVQAIPVVAKGEFVDILLQKGKVRVAVQGVARESGSAGELIWVENAVSHKLIRVTIKEKGVVLAPQGGNSI